MATCSNHETNNRAIRQHAFLVSQSTDVISEVSSGLLHRALVQSDDVVQRTISLAASCGNEQIVDGLLSCAREGDVRARSAMCQSLGTLAVTSQDRAHDAIDILLLMLTTDANWSVRFNAAEALRVNVHHRLLYVFIYLPNTKFYILHPLHSHSPAP